MARAHAFLRDVALLAFALVLLGTRPANAEPGPAIRILAPAADAQLEAETVAVEALVSPKAPATRVTAVKIQGKPAKPHAELVGVWVLDVAFGEPGPYQIEVVATDDRGETSSAKVRVERLPNRPAAATRLPTEVQWLCMYSGARPTGSTVAFAEWVDTQWAPSGDAQRALDEICRQAAVVAPPRIGPGPVPNCAAAIRGTERVVVFNPEFVKQLRAETRSDWSFVSVLAHELGHHINGHTLQSGGSNPAIELQADESSGMIMARLGATLADAQLAIDTLGTPMPTSTHPAKDDRLRAIQKGFRAGQVASAEPAEPEVPPIRIPPPAMDGERPGKGRPDAATARLTLTSATIRHDVDQTNEFGTLRGMTVTPVGTVVGCAGKRARLAIRFAYADGTPLRAMAGDTLHDDGNGNLVIVHDFDVAVDALDLATGSFFLSYAALNFQPTGFAVVHQLSLTVEVSVPDAALSRKSPRVGFAFRW